MKFVRFVLFALSVALLLTTAAPVASAQAEHVRWDIASVTCDPLTGTYPCVINSKNLDGTTPTATATAMDCALTQAGIFGDVGCSSITLTGSGTFAVPAGAGTSSAVTGGGTWEVFASCPATSAPPACIGGTISKGTFVVTELVSFQKSEPLVLPTVCGSCETTDNIGDAAKLWGGLAVVRVAYSDGTTGILTLTCSALPDPAPVAEGVTATKSVSLNNVSLPGVNSPPLPPPPYFQTSKVLVPVLFWNPGLNQYSVEFHVN